VLLIAAFMGSILGLVMKSRASLREGQYIPFGPSLTAAALIFLVMGWWLLDAGAFTILEPLVVRVL
jgi:prepilin signal peptidase PulO-like enzyme (type II secretory pathway)